MNTTTISTGATTTISTTPDPTIHIRTTDHPRLESALRAPTLADFIRGRRTRPTASHPHGYSREELSRMMHHSTSYLAQLENGQKHSPTAGWCDAFAQALGLTPSEIQHLHDLATPAQSWPRPLDWPSIDTYQNLIHADMRAAAQALDPHLVAYLDERWNVLYANDAYSRAHPGLLADGNVLIWYFRNPTSRHVVVDWETETRHLAGRLRALMARYHNPTWALELLDLLGEDPEFRRVWHTGVVAFARPSSQMRLRDSQGAVYSITVEITQLLRGCPLQKFLGITYPPTSQ